MKWVIGIIAFIVALPVTMIAFQYMPEAYFEWMRRNSWGREVSGLLMTAIAVAIAYAVAAAVG